MKKDIARSMDLALEARWAIASAHALVSALAPQLADWWARAATWAQTLAMVCDLRSTSSCKTSTWKQTTQRCTGNFQWVRRILQHILNM